MYRILVGMVIVGVPLLSGLALNEAKEGETESTIIMRMVVPLLGEWDGPVSNASDLVFLAAVASEGGPIVKQVKVELAANDTKTQIAEKLKTAWNQAHPSLPMSVCPGDNGHLFYFNSESVGEMAIVDKFLDTHNLSGNWAGLPHGIRIRIVTGTACPGTD